MRVGSGYDIHKLIKKRPFILGNVEIPYEKGFKAHSDGDVLIHSIIDALLGAANLGDIGTHFPDNDIKYKDIDSKVLLEQTVELIGQKSYKIINIDSTVICEKPKLKEYIQEIKEKLSKIIKIEIENISIKAKTKEKLDASGKGKAVEVHTVCLIDKI